MNVNTINAGDIRRCLAAAIRYREVERVFNWRKLLNFSICRCRGCWVVTFTFDLLTLTLFLIVCLTCPTHAPILFIQQSSVT